MSVIDKLSNIGKAIFSKTKDLEKSISRGLDIASKKALDVDRFFSASNPVIKK